MLKNIKKGQGISINTVIIAAIALAVLVVLFMIFTGRFKIFSEGVSETASCQNTCRGLAMLRSEASNKESCQLSQGTYVPGSYKDISQGNVCCCQPQ